MGEWTGRRCRFCDRGSEPDYTLTDPGTIVEGEIAEISVMVEDLPAVASFTDNALTDWNEDKTNVRVNWDVVPQEGYEQQLSLTIASGDLPDYTGSGLNRSTITVYGQDGVFIPVNDLIDNHSHWLKNLMNESDGLRRARVPVRPLRGRSD